MSDDELEKFEVWLRDVQGYDPAALSPEELALWRADHAQVMANPTPKVGLMKLRAQPGDHLYAVAIRDGAELWLTLWVRRDARGDVYVLIPRGVSGWDPHTSYHRDGTFHSKSFGKEIGQSESRQPLNKDFKGTEHLGAYAGHGKSIGAVCSPDDFTGVIEVEPGTLTGRNGWVAVDLVEPNCEPLDMGFTGKVTHQRIFDEAFPSLVIRVGIHDRLSTKIAQLANRLSSLTGREAAVLAQMLREKWSL
jgi:hypothetical protein